MKRKKMSTLRDAQAIWEKFPALRQVNVLFAWNATFGGMSRQAKRDRQALYLALKRLESREEVKP